MSRWITIIVCVYIGLSCVDLSSPGLEYDEVLFAQGALGGGEGPFVPYAWKLGAIQVPVMLMPYIGAVKAWLYTPIFAVFGTDPWVVRFPMIALGAATIACTAQVARVLFGPREAVLAALLLAFDASFFFGIREDYGPIAIMLFTKTASLALLSRFAMNRSAVSLFVASVLLGIGLYDKFNFAWYIGAASAALLIVWPRSIRTIERREAQTAIVGILIGCWPLLVFNFVTRGGTFAGVEPEPLGQEFSAKLGAIQWTFDGIAFPAFALGAAPDGLRLLLGTLALSIPAAFLARRHLARRSFSFICLMMIFIVAAIFVTPRATGGHHAMMLWPFPHLIVASACVAARDALASGGERLRPARFLPIAAALALLFTSGALVLRTLREFRTTGGRGFWSDAIYELAAVVGRDPQHRYLIMDWGISTQLLLLSEGAAKQEEIFWSLLDPAREAEAAESLYERAKDSSVLFVLRAPGSENFPLPARIFDAMLQRHDQHADIVHRIRERDGREAFRIARASQSEGKPSEASAGLAVTERNERGWISAEPVQPLCVRGLAAVALSWAVPGVDKSEIRVSAPDGPLLTAAGPSGTATTERWVTPGMAFYIQDATHGGVTSSTNTLIKIETHVSCPNGS